MDIIPLLFCIYATRFRQCVVVFFLLHTTPIYLFIVAPRRHWTDLCLQLCFVGLHTYSTSNSCPNQCKSLKHPHTSFTQLSSCIYTQSLGFCAWAGLFLKVKNGFKSNTQLWPNFQTHKMFIYWSQYRKKSSLSLILFLDACSLVHTHTCLSAYLYKAIAVYN